MHRSRRTLASASPAATSKRRTLLALLAVIPLLALSASPTWADDSPAPLTGDRGKSSGDGSKDAEWWASAPSDSKVDSFGAFSDSIPIAVPSFHGITPSLGVNYRSSGGNGWVGVGWSLGGVGSIERASPGKGSPKYDATDIYLLGGEELVPCATGSVSPSCTTGGTHSTKTEGYARIALSGTGTAATWTITAKDGTKSVYGSVLNHPGANGTLGNSDDQIFRYGLKQVIDTKNNTVTYSWGSNQFGGNWEYLDSISYNGTLVKFHYESRTDVETGAIGGVLESVNGRLKTIDVTVGGSRVRSYKLSYTTSGATARSLLSSVQQFGKDATLDASGTVTAGTSLPAVTAGYPAVTTAAFVAATTDTGMSAPTEHRHVVLDANGDGKSDMVEIWKQGCPLACEYRQALWLSNGSTFTKESERGAPGYDETGHFLAMDVNGDGKDDLVTLTNSGSGKWRRYVYLSTGTGFVDGAQDTSMTYVIDPINDVNDPKIVRSHFLPIDINGDGKTDLLELYPRTDCFVFVCHPKKYVRVAWLSNGTGFTKASETWGMDYDTRNRYLPIDFDGDGKWEFVSLKHSGTNTLEIRPHLSDGTEFTALPAIATSTYNEHSELLTLDVNGDGKTDLLELLPEGAGARRKVWISTGRAFELASSEWLSGLILNDKTRAISGDFNGDGRGDYALFNSGLLNVQRVMYLSTESTFVTGTVDYLGAYQKHQYLTGDINGDGRSDVVELYSSFGTTTRVPWLSGGVQPDLLATIANGLGATTSVSYTPSSAWTNVGNPPVVQTATSVTVNPGRGASSTTTYSFSGGAYDSALRRPLGFAYQKETLPCNSGETACPYNETWYRQDNAALGKASRIDVRDGAGNLHRSELLEYTTNSATVPWTALQTGRWVHVYVGTNAGTACPGVDCKRRYRGRVFNAYGEVTQEVEYGDYDVAGDENTVSTVYVPNTTAFIVDRVADVKTYQGVGTTGALLNETVSYYDGAATWNQAPSAGLLTKTARWLSSPSSFVVTENEHDAWGNVTATVNELGARTTVVFDATYHVFPISSTNALNHMATETWDPVCGVQTAKVGLNGQTTTTTYDALCRVVTTTEPGGKFTTHAWSALGNPNAQWEEITTPGADASGSHFRRRFFDGLGRTWRTAQKGPDAVNGDIYVDVSFNARGEEAAKSAPYFYVSGTPTMQITTYKYDALDRPVRVTHPDGAFATTSYGLWSVTNTDELGRSMTDRLNAYGNRVAHEETVGGTVRTTTYAYDARQHLQQTTDPAGNVTTTNTTDSLGRMTQSIDLDWGTTTYEYDGAGRLTATVDAKNQRTTVAYDALDRKTSKTTRAGTPQATTVSWTYDQPRSGYYNVGSLTTTTDGAGTKSLDYDALGRLVKAVRTINGASFTVEHGFDAAGRPRWTTYPDGDTLGTSAQPLVYDGAGRLKSIPGYVTSATYNAEGGVTQIDNVNGTTTTRAYSAQRGWLTNITTVKGATTLQNLVYTPNAKGMVTSVTSPIAEEGWTYSYDELDRLTTATNASDSAHDQTLTYDAIGNITSNSRVGAYTYHATKKHAVATAGASSYVYDATGLMTSGAGRTMTWDGDNRLATVTSDGVTSTMTYDADGARIQQVEGSVTRRYLGDDYEVEGDTTVKYVSLGGVPVAKKDGTTKTWIHTDHLGSIQAATDASGIEVLRKKYRSYGEVLSSSGPQDDESRGYTAQRHDGSGLVYLHARYYDGALGRFISADDVIDGPRTVGINRYAYTANDPINHSDVMGRCITCVIDAYADPSHPIHDVPKVHDPTSFTDRLGLMSLFVPVPAAPIAQGGKALVAGARSWWASRHTLALGVAQGGAVAGSTAIRGTAAGAGAGRLFVADDAPFPDHVGNYANEAAAAARHGVGPAAVGGPGARAAMRTGSVKWVVTLDGELMIAPSIHKGFFEIKHSVLAGKHPDPARGDVGNDVLAAGRAYFGRNWRSWWRIRGRDIDNWTGHYEASDPSLRTGVEAFDRHGITFERVTPRGR